MDQKQNPSFCDHPVLEYAKLECMAQYEWINIMIIMELDQILIQKKVMATNMIGSHSFDIEIALIIFAMPMKPHFIQS